MARCNVPVRGALVVLAAASFALPLSAQQEVWRVPGHAGFERFGAGIANWIDRDGDGVDDLLVGVPQAPSSHEPASVRIVSGRDLATLLEVSSGSDGHEGFGERVANVGDVDGDGTPDLAVAATLATFVRVLSGVDGAQLGQWTSPQASSGFGASLAALGDLDGDGCADVAIGAPDESASGVKVGAVRVLSGKTGALLQRLTGLTRLGRLGDRDRLAAIEDLDGDGRRDLALLDRITIGTSEYGHLRLVSTATWLDLLTVTFDFADYVEYEPVSIAAVGDLDSDGLQDVAVGALPIDPSQSHGKAFVFSSASGAERMRADLGKDPGWAIVGDGGDADGDGRSDLLVAVDDLRVGARTPSVVLHRSSDGAQLLRLAGPRGSEYGRAFAAGADLDGDGVRDVAIGDAGAVLNLEARGEVELQTLPAGSLLASRLGEVVVEYFSAALAHLGDVDGDGHGDLVAISVGSLFGTQQALILSGSDGAILARHPVPSVPDGPAIALPDLDGDGVGDFAVAARLLGQNGQVDVISSVSGAVLQTFAGTSSNSQFGFSLAVAVQPSGAVQLAIGSPTSSLGAKNGGMVEVFDVATGALVFQLTANSVGERLGHAVAALGDVDGDGVSDWAVGSPKHAAGGNDAGRVRVVSGATGLLIKRIDGASGDELGDQIASPGDVDGDGIGDLALVAAGFDRYRGELRLFSSAGWGQLVALSGNARGDHFGQQFAVLPDQNGDGLAEWVVRAATPSRLEVRSGLGDLLVSLAVPADGRLAAPAFGAARSATGDAIADLALGRSNFPETEAFLVQLDDLPLQIDPAVAFAGDTVTASVRGGRTANVVALQLLAVNGLPNGSLIDLGAFDVVGEFHSVDVVPPGLAGFTYTLRAYAIGWNGKIASSLDQELEFQ